MSSAWIGLNLGTTALSNYHIQVVARVGGVSLGCQCRQWLGVLRPVGGSWVVKMRIISTEEGGCSNQGNRTT